MLLLPTTAMSMRETFITTTSKPPRLFRCPLRHLSRIRSSPKPIKTHKTQTSTVYRSTDSSPCIPFKPTPFICNPILHHKPQTRTLRTSTKHQNNPTKTHVTQHYPLQHQLEHGTTNRLLLHLLIRHIIIPNHLLHSATRTPPSATFWKLYLPEELSPEPPSAANLTSIY